MKSRQQLLSTIITSALVSFVVAALLITLAVQALQRDDVAALQADANATTQADVDKRTEEPSSTQAAPESSTEPTASSSAKASAAEQALAAATPTSSPSGDSAAADPTPTAQQTRGWQPTSPLPANFKVTSPTPSLDDLNAIIHFLVATPASDAAKAENLEGGRAAVLIPQTVYRLGLFRAPLGWKEVSGPLELSQDRAVATLDSESAGRPGVHTRIQFVYRDGNWRLANASICEGVRTVGLPLECPA